MKNNAYICSAKSSYKDNNEHTATSYIGVVSLLLESLFGTVSQKQKGSGALFFRRKLLKITSMRNRVITSNRVNNSSFVASIRTILCALGVLMLLTLPALGDSSPRIIFGWLAAAAALILAGKGFSFQHINR